jgi:hypothetical protein
MAAFTRRAIPRPVTSNSWRSNGEAVFDNHFVAIPSLDPGTMIKGEGRQFGTGGQYANRVYLNTWYVIGPFDGANGRRLFDAPVYPPEQRVLLDAVYRGKANRMLKWRYLSSPSYPFVPPDVDDAAVYYGYTEVMSEQAQTLTMWVGADDDIKLWLNDQIVWNKGNFAKQPYFDTVYNTAHNLYGEYNLTEGKKVIHLNKGRNKFFFKLSNGPNHAYVSVVLTK